MSANVFMILNADNLSLRMRLCGNVQADQILASRQMETIQEWMNSNSLVFNPDKTKILIIKHGKEDIYKDFKLTMSGNVITLKKPAGC